MVTSAKEISVISIGEHLLDVIGCGVDVREEVVSPGGTLLEKSGVFITLTTLATPPLAWFKVFQQCFPAINFEISVKGKEITKELREGKSKEQLNQMHSFLRLELFNQV